MSPFVVLVGPPGAGKTTVGRALAERLHVTFVDTDELVERATGLSVSDIFVQQGEQRFRALERDAVSQSLTSHEGVLSLGGGSIADPATRGDLQKLRHRASVVFLDVSVATAMRRLGLDRGRPLLLGDDETMRQKWRRLYDDRRGWYVMVSDFDIGTDKKSPAETVDELVAALTVKDTSP